MVARTTPKLWRVLWRHVLRVSVVEWEAAATPDRVVGRLGREELSLSARPVDGAPAWLRRGGWAFNLERSPGGDAPSRAVREAIESLRRGLLVVTLPATPSSPGVSGAPTRQPVEVPGDGAARLDGEVEDLADVALRLFQHNPHVLPRVWRRRANGREPARSLVLQQRYPFPAWLGEPWSTERAVAAWASFAERARGGQVPASLGLYVHIPFCALDCTYCYCARFPSRDGDTMSAYVKALLQELRPLARCLRGVPVSTVYYGGGTPSALPPRELDRLLVGVLEHLRVEADAQITLEVEPRTVSPERMARFRRLGRVNRITLGVQTLEPHAQRLNGRPGDRDAIESLVHAAHAEGMDVSLDLMAGLDGQTLEGFKADLRWAARLGVSALGLGPFLPLSTDTLTADPAQVTAREEMMRWARNWLKTTDYRWRAGMPPVCREGGLNRQLLSLASGFGSVLGVGVSATSHIWGSHSYVNLPSTGRGVPFGHEVDAYTHAPPRRRSMTVQGQDQARHTLIHSLHQGELDLEEFTRWFGATPWELFPTSLGRLAHYGWIRQEGAYLRRTATSPLAMYLIGASLFAPEVLARMKARAAGGETLPGRGRLSLLRSLLRV